MALGWPWKRTKTLVYWRTGPHPESSPPPLLKGLTFLRQGSCCLPRRNPWGGVVQPGADPASPTPDGHPNSHRSPGGVDMPAEAGRCIPNWFFCLQSLAEGKLGPNAAEENGHWLAGDDGNFRRVGFGLGPSLDAMQGEGANTGSQVS